MKPKTRLSIVPLEDRSLPATFGIPWGDPNISVSFAPDGTSIAGRTSTLFEGLNASQSENEWQQEILSAFSTWASYTNLNISVVPDSGARFGTPGRAQNDPRFGDIRIGGNQLASNVLAITSPPDPALSGTLSGDVFINTSFQFDGQPYDLNRVILHEAGHALGLDHSTDVNSPMFPRFNNTVSGLTTSDIEAIRKLYGPRVPDRNEGTFGNGSIATASRIPVPTSYTGTTPLLTFGDLGSSTDKDTFWFDTLTGDDDDDQNITVQLQSAGLSLLGAKVIVYTRDSNGQLQEVANVTSDSADYTGDVLSVTFDGNDDDDNTSRRYFVRVQKSDSAPFAQGRYALSVNFDGVSTTTPAALQQVILGSYQNVNANDLARLLQNPTTTLVNVDNGTNNSTTTATRLASTSTFQGTRRYEAIGSISTTTDVDFYRVVAPLNETTKILTVNAWALPGQAVRPRLSVVAANGSVVPSEILVNDNGSFTIQAKNVQPGAVYFVRVVRGTANTGNYFLTANFGNKATVVQQFAQGTLSSTTATRTDTLYIAQAQLFHLTLTTQATGVPTGTAVRMTIFDSAGQTVLDISARAGDTVSSASVLLRPGAYTVRYTAVGNGAAAVAFSVRGNRITDPVGPVVDDPTLEPIYINPSSPSEFIYPDFIFSTDPFLWLFDI